LLAACSGITACASAAPGSSEGGPRFLIAGEHGLAEYSAGGRKTLIDIEKGAYALDPALSRDGRQIAFALQSPAKVQPNGDVDFGSDLYLTSREGKDVKLLLRHQAVAEFLRTPDWLPDGRLLLAVRGRSAAGEQDLRIESLDPASGQGRRLIDDAIDPVVSPDGRSLLYVKIDPVTQAEALTIASLDDPNNGRPLAGTANNLALITSATWSPDGRRIVFAAVDVNLPLIEVTPSTNTQRYHPFAQDVWLVERDGTGLRRFLELSDNQPSLDWSADGAIIYSLGITGFWRIDAVTAQREQVGIAVPLGQVRVLP
jgi:Tol biopolymer transport system component